MTREAVYERLTETFRDVFGNDSIVINDATTAIDIKDWDSLEHVNLLVAVESEFDITFEMGDVVTLQSVGEMVNIIMEQTE